MQEHEPSGNENIKIGTDINGATVDVQNIQQAASVTTMNEGITSTYNGDPNSGFATVDDWKDYTLSQEKVVDNKRLKLTNKELASLKRNKYDRIMNNFSKSYVLANIKTGKVVEIKASSSYHACNMIGWRPKNTRVLKEIDKRETPPAPLDTTTSLGQDIPLDTTTRIEV